MNMGKIGLLSLSLMLSSLSYSELVEVYTWKAFPGKTNEMVSLFSEAKAIHEKHGASISIVAQGTGSTQEIDYVMRWDSPQDWGSSLDKMAAATAGKEWQEFMAKANANPLGEMVASNAGANMDVSKTASDFDGNFVYGVWVWKPAPGRTAEMIQSAMESEKIHEELGAQVEIYQENVGGTGMMHYVMMWKNHSDWADSVVKMNASKKWAEYLAEQDPNVSTLMASHRGQTLVAQ